MALVSTKLSHFLSSHFIFSGNSIIVQGEDNSLPDELVLKKCFDLNVAADWFNDEEYNFTAVELERGCPVPAGCSEIPLRQFFWENTEKSDSVKKAARAKCLLNFRRDKRFCSFCGKPLKDDSLFTARTCTFCKKQFFPQLEPAVIVLIHKEDKILLAHHKNRSDGIYSCIAGFVEAGETIEETVVREIKEETGLTVKNIRYAGSQSWPFPDQLMLAFECEWERGEIKIQEEELSDAQWFDRKNLPPLPNPGSVAYNLIHSMWNK